MNKKAIAVDFDGVIHKYSNGWMDGTIYDEPCQGVAKALYELQKQGFEIIIYSTRNYARCRDGKYQNSQVEEMKSYMDKHNIPFDTIHIEAGKPICKLFIDDNAYRFGGIWDDNTIWNILGILKKE